jgi:uncharacterized protein (TIGR02300 family)
MSKNADRGTKRTCQNATCGARFYDLNRDPITCPICGTVYEIAVSPLVAAGAAEERTARRPAAKPEFLEQPTPGETPEAIGDEELVETAEGEEAIAADDDETFLEDEEEDGGDMSGIIGGPVSEEGEEP